MVSFAWVGGPSSALTVPQSLSQSTSWSPSSKPTARLILRCICGATHRHLLKKRQESRFVGVAITFSILATFGPILHL